MTIDALRLLIADDHPAARESLVRAVSDPGIEVVAVVGDGRSALIAARRLHPDVALLDLRMPGLSGSQVASALRLDGSATRVIVLSAHDEPSLVAAVLEAGAAAFLSKEATGEQIRLAVERQGYGRLRC